ncbi:MAG TPA: hypothetical protein VGM92_04110 [Candidatus Kapabacteria bacterium]|jgi:shikimate dehydrogenase
MNVLKAAVLGKQLAQSISPEVHRQIFPLLKAACNSSFDAIEYLKIELGDEREFFDFVEHAESQGFRGGNVTFPYKYCAAQIAGELTSEVERNHSANTIAFGDERKVISTDGFGFLFSLEKNLPNLRYSDFVLTVLGAGGAARAVLAAISHLGWKKMTVAARSPQKAERSFSGFENISVIPLDGIRRENFSRNTEPHFIVQATPVGQRSLESLLSHFAWSSEDIAADLVYNPLITRFLDNARKSGARIIDGLGMLIEQAALSQYFWMIGMERNRSALSQSEFNELHRSLSPFVTPLWDAFAI